MQALRIGRVPEDRLTTGMIGAIPLAESMALPFVDAPPFSRRGILDRAAIRSFATEQIEKFDIRTSGPESASGERRAASGERRAASGERRAASGERRAASGERDAVRAKAGATPP